MRSHSLCEFGIGKRSKPDFVAVRKEAPQLAPSCCDAGNDERCVPQVDETDFTTFVDSPAMP